MASRGSNASSTFSVLGSDIKITGDISASADLHIDGSVEGDISCASLVQGDASTINGAVVAESARLAGRVTGSITARELVILKTAQIEGDVHYDALTIEQGAQVEGRFAHRERRTGTASEAAATQPSGKPELTIAG
ncbi:polymer-forming cytoskeletal protein [Porphyrobacter algicida]|uniref:Polymer-forming cytoskeletal protein n=1 Tax=Qipengyuania algicida TaxID=1836209 RepID=A0A845AGN6_9SPHN|nr:polymer-forming cytoskeletal protein [Qipengyuania algicida]MXP27985.1 polymer-forming cytoskeletal protein [Qipengyuania algicida]